MARGPLAHLFAANTAHWQRALAVWRVLGVRGAGGLALGNTRPLTVDWLDEGRLANLLALQRGLGLGNPGAVVEQGFAGYVGNYAMERVAGRLLFLEQAGLAHLVVADVKEWRRERGLPPNKASPGEPPLISLNALVTASNAKLAAAAAAASEAELTTFIAGLPSHPPYRQLLAEVAELRERLLRDPEVARLSGEAPVEAGS